MKYIKSEGSFEAIVTDPKEVGWICESDEKATPFVRIPVQVTEEGTEKDSVGVWQGWLSNAAFDRTIKSLVEAFGFNGDLAGLATGRQSFTGKPCNVTVKPEEYDGKTYFKVKWLNAPGGGASAPKPIERTKLEQLIAEMNKRAIQVAASTGKEEPAPAVPDNDDGPPF